MSPITIKVASCEQCYQEYIETPETHAHGTDSRSPVILAGFCSKGCERGWFAWERRQEELTDLMRDEALERITEEAS